MYLYLFQASEVRVRRVVPEAGAARRHAHALVHLHRQTGANR